jgi:hypothetical protein
MQTGTSLTQVTDTLEGNTKLKQVNLVVFTETHNLTGNTYCMKHQRLLDVLNQDFIPNSLPIGKEFMPLTQVEVSFPRRKSEFMASIYVRKANILFVGENIEHQPEAPKAEDRARNYRVRAKKFIEAEIHMPLYKLMGQMYFEVWQKLLDALDRADKFIPLTNVRIYPEQENTVFRFDFAAVNRDKIIYLGEYLKPNEAPSASERIYSAVNK